MPYSGSTFTNVAGATTAVAGDVVQSATWDNIHTDYATAFTQVMSQVVAGVTNRNILWMNGGCEIWQQGAGGSSSIAVASAATAYTADRWYLLNGASLAQVVAAVTGLTSQSQLAARIRRNAGITTSTLATWGYPLDSDELQRMRGKIVTFSCVVQAGANWSPTSGTLTVALYVGTGATVRKRGAGFTSETTVLSISTNLTAGGAVTAISGSSSAVVPATSAQGELQFTWTPTGAAGAADDITIDDVMVEAQLSSTTWAPTNFDRLPFLTMLRGCQRYFAKTFEYGVAPAGGAGYQGALGVNVGNIQAPFIWWQYPVDMRATAGITTFNPVTATNSNWHDIVASADVVVSVNATNTGSKATLIFSATATTAVVPLNTFYIHAMASAGI